MRAQYVFALWALAWSACHAQITPTVVDLPTREGVTQRMLVIAPTQPKAAVVLFSGGNGALQIQPNGALKDGNFLVRSRQLFASRDLLTVVVDAPSDRQSSPYLSGFRQTPEHVADIKSVIAWLHSASNTKV